MARIEDRPQRELAAFGPVLEDCFANVEPGDRITGLSDGFGAAQFFVNGQQSCEIEDTDFSNSFFAIWLGDKIDPEADTRFLSGPEGEDEVTRLISGKRGGPGGPAAEEPPELASLLEARDR